MATLDILRQHALRAPKDLHCACGLDVTGVSYEDGLENWAEHVAQLVAQAHRGQEPVDWHARAIAAEDALRNIGAAYARYRDAFQGDVKGLARARLYTLLFEQFPEPER